jgi:hypothetical protein
MSLSCEFANIRIEMLGLCFAVDCEVFVNLTLLFFDLSVFPELLRVSLNEQSILWMVHLRFNGLVACCCLLHVLWTFQSFDFLVG